jgi:hypothetical protein
LLAARVASNDPLVKQELAYTLTQQRADGGFSYSTDPSIGSDTNDTAAAIMALSSAQGANLGSAAVAKAIASAKSYELASQNTDGGFPYDPLTPIAWGGPVSDGSSTSWALMALTSLGDTNSAQSTKAQAYLRSLPLADGSFPSWQPAIGDVFDTAPAITALAGGTYPLRTYQGTVPTPAPSPTVTPAGAVLGAQASPSLPNVLPAVGSSFDVLTLFLLTLLGLATFLAIRSRRSV